MNVDSPEAHVRQLLRDWVTSKARRPVNGDLRDDTPILEQRVITSLQVMELILFVEKTCGRAVDLAQLRPSSFRSIEDIYQTFLPERTMENLQFKEIEAPAFAGYGNGHRALSGAALRLFQDLDRLFLGWAAACGASEYQFPSTIPAAELNKIGYFKSFPHHVTFPAALDDDHDNLAGFSSSEPLGADGTLRLAKCAPVRDVLTPAACYHFYVNFQNEALDAPRYMTTRATCFRRESRYVTLRRQWSFSMREIVCIGTAAEVQQFLDARRKTAQEFFAAIGLPIAWDRATDPFFNPSANLKYLVQRLDPVKTEMVYGGDLAIGSVNFHRNYFGEAFGIKRDGAEAFSGCIAFGLDRWIHAFIAHFGDNPAGWPDLDAWKS